MIELFKIIKEIYDSTCALHIHFTGADLIKIGVTISNLFQHHLHNRFKEIQLY